MARWSACLHGPGNQNPGSGSQPPDVTLIKLGICCPMVSMLAARAGRELQRLSLAAAFCGPGGEPGRAAHGYPGLDRWPPVIAQHGCGYRTRRLAGGVFTWPWVCCSGSRAVLSEVSAAAVVSNSDRSLPNLMGKKATERACRASADPELQGFWAEAPA